MCEAKTKEEMIEASKIIRDYLRSHAERSDISKKIAICGKGGVGKSVTTTLMASAMTEEGYTVLAIDTDESNPGLHRMFGFDEQPRPLIKLIDRFSIGETKPEDEWLARDEIPMNDIPSEYILQSNNLKFMMVGKIIDPFEGCACSMSDLLRGFLGKVVLADKEIILVDMEAGVESFGRGVERSVDTVLIIVEPSSESLAVAEKITYMADGIGIRRVRAILNKVPSEKIEARMTEMLDKKGVKTIGTVYLDPQVSEACFDGETLGDSRARKDIRIIARLLLDESSANLDSEPEKGEIT